MLPTIEARESITAANRHAVGSGTLAKDALRDITRGWETAAHGGVRPVIRPTIDQLPALGIQVTRVPRKAEA